MAGPPQRESKLIADAKAGRVSAYEDLVRMHEVAAVRVAFLVVADESDARDVVQEAFVKAYYALSRFDSENPFRPWLMKIVVNEARNALKAAGRRGALASRYAEGVASGQSAQSPESAALDGELRRQLMEAIGRLKDDDQTVIHMRYFVDFSNNEIAETLGWRPGTVRSRVSRASQRLRAVIHESYPDLRAAASGAGAKE